MDPLTIPLTALVSSLRMIRRVAGIYGGRPGFFSSWRLTRAVLAHLAATGAVAAGDDLLEPVAAHRPVRAHRSHPLSRRCAATSARPREICALTVPTLRSRRSATSP